jgi:hypothetical protein
MHDQLCELCDQPATVFFNYAISSTDGRSAGPEPSSSRQFCAVHARAYQDQQNREMLNRLPQKIRKWSKGCPSTGQVALWFAANANATEFQADLTRIYRADATISEKDNEWEVLLTLPVNVIDQWECENWSQQLLELCQRHECRPTGFQFFS